MCMIKLFYKLYKFCRFKVSQATTTFSFSTLRMANFRLPHTEYCDQTMTSIANARVESWLHSKAENEKVLVACET